MSELNFGTWEVPESPVAIQYSLVAIEEIRHSVMLGFQKLSRGGIEVGGVLYGIRDGKVNRILAIRTIECEHALGPSFQLSERDRSALSEQLKQDRVDTQLEGFVCLGWFVSHTRSEILLNSSDLDIYTAYFPEAWQVTLVVRPGRGSNMRAGFFVRERDGTVCAEQSHLEFPFPDRLAAIFEGRERPVSPIREPRSPSRSSGSIREASFPAREAAPPAVEPPAPPRRQKRWHWLVIWATAVVALAAVGVHLYFSQPSAGLYFFRFAAEPMGLSVLEHDGQLQIDWSRTSRPIVKATHGSLEIEDGKTAPRMIALAPMDLAQGTFTYRPESGEVRVRLVVDSPDGTKAEEAATYIDPKPRQETPDPQADDRRAELEAEVARLRKTNSEQAERIQQLDRTLRILQTRLGAK